jgi:hypothetical protein
LADPVLECEQHGDVARYAEDHLGKVAGDLPEISPGSWTVGATPQGDYASDKQENKDRYDLPDFTEHAAQAHDVSHFQFASVRCRSAIRPT